MRRRRRSRTASRGCALIDELPQRDGATDVMPPRTESDELALMVYTGGTTGRPKGVMLDHADLVATAAMIVDWFEMTVADRCLLVLPLFHVNGIMVSVVSPLVAGGSTVIAPRFDPKTFWDLVERVRPTYFSAVPTIYAMLTGLPAEVRADTASLRCVVCGAAPMPAAAIHAFEDRYGVSILEGYGQSEGTVVTTANPLTGLRKPGTVGLPLPGQEVRVVGNDDEPLPAGQVGEVTVRGPNVMRGYLGKPAETAETLRRGWLHTGDLGRFDEDGYLVLVDRLKDMIIRTASAGPAVLDPVADAGEARWRRRWHAGPTSVVSERWRHGQALSEVRSSHNWPARPRGLVSLRAGIGPGHGAAVAELD